MSTEDRTATHAWYRALRIQAETEQMGHDYVAGHGTSCVLDGRTRAEHREPLAVVDRRIRSMIREYLDGYPKRMGKVRW